MDNRARQPFSVLIAGLVMLFALSGCGSGPDATERDVPLTELTCSSLDGASGIWESAPFPLAADCGAIDAGSGQCCPWLRFPGGATLRIEHGLGRVPRRVDGTIAFDSFGVGGTPASGDAFRVLASDATVVTVENRTDQRFYLRIALE